MKIMAVINYNGHVSELIGEVHKNAGFYQQIPISKNEMYSFGAEEQKGLAYHLTILRVPLLARVPQVGNHCPN